jgi:hypothetical protein
MANLEQERDNEFINILSTTTIIISAITFILLAGYLLVSVFISDTPTNSFSFNLIIAYLLLSIVLVSGSISIRKFYSYGYVVLSGFFGLLALLLISSIVYLIVYNIMNGVIFSLNQVITYIVLAVLSSLSYFIYKRLKQIFRS